MMGLRNLSPIVNILVQTTRPNFHMSSRLHSKSAIPHVDIKKFNNSHPSDGGCGTRVASDWVMQHMAGRQCTEILWQVLSRREKATTEHPRSRLWSTRVSNGHFLGAQISLHHRDTFRTSASEETSGSLAGPRREIDTLLQHFADSDPAHEKKRFVDLLCHADNASRGCGGTPYDRRHPAFEVVLSSTS